MARTKHSAPIPPIRVGSRAVTYTPPGPSGIERYSRLVFRCEILSLFLDGDEVESVDPDRDYSRHDLRADLRLPDGSIVTRAPYHDQERRDPAAYDGSSWCRPYITSMNIR